MAQSKTFLIAIPILAVCEWPENALNTALFIGDHSIFFSVDSLEALRVLGLIPGLLVASIASRNQPQLITHSKVSRIPKYYVPHFFAPFPLPKYRTYRSFGPAPMITPEMAHKHGRAINLTPGPNGFYVRTATHLIREHLTKGNSYDRL